MDRSWLRVAEKLVYHDPVSYLIELRRFEVKLAMSDTAPKLKALRTNGLRVAREQRQAAIFCHGMSERLGHKIYFASDEGQDYDFIASSLIEGARYYVPVQLKEVVSVEENPHSSIEAVIASLTKYTESKGLTVAIYLNQGVLFNPSALQIPELNIGELWVFGNTTHDSSRWAVWGDFTKEQSIGTQFFYP